MKILIPAAALLSAFAAIPCAAAPDGMSEADEAIAKMQIIDVLNRYALAHNTDDPAGYAALFTEDGSFGATKGREAIRQMAERDAARLHSNHESQEGPHRFGFLRTLTMNPVIDLIDATHAKSVAYYIVVVPDVDDGDRPVIFAAGTYQDEFRKEGGKWLIARRTPYAGLSAPGLGKKLGL